MFARVILSTILLAVVYGGWNGQSVQRGSGIKLATAVGRNGTGARGSGLKLNFSGRGGGSRTTSIPDLWNSSTILLSTPASIPYETNVENSNSNTLHVGLVVPYKSFGVREYTKAVTSAKAGLSRKLGRLFRHYGLQVHLSMKELTPSPTCKQ